MQTPQGLFVFTTSLCNSYTDKRNSKRIIGALLKFLPGSVVLSLPRVSSSGYHLSWESSTVETGQTGCHLSLPPPPPIQLKLLNHPGGCTRCTGPFQVSGPAARHKQPVLRTHPGRRVKNTLPTHQPVAVEPVLDKPPLSPTVLRPLPAQESWRGVAWPGVRSPGD